MLEAACLRLAYAGALGHSSAQVEGVPSSTEDMGHPDIACVRRFRLTPACSASQRKVNIAMVMQSTVNPARMASGSHTRSADPPA